jgi:hypothetical protein
LHRWLEERHEWSPEWRDAADQNDYYLDLDAEQLRALMAELRQVVGRYRDAAAEAPADAAERVIVLIHGFPSPEDLP